MMQKSGRDGSTGLSVVFSVIDQAAQKPFVVCASGIVRSPFVFAGGKEFSQVFLRTTDGSFSLPILTGWKYSDTMEPPLTKWLPMADIPSSLFNGMLHPLLRSPITGATWYQGESNVGDAAGYALKFPLMIADWCIHFRQGYFPFYFVQLANFAVPSELPSQVGWPLLREAQASALHVPNTGMATAIAVGDPLDIHPRDKKSVGHRLALQALAATSSTPDFFFWITACKSAGAIAAGAGYGAVGTCSFTVI